VDAGIIATGTLEMLVKGKTVVCQPKTTDRYGRTVAICRADDEDLGRTMVQLGMAWAFVRYSRDYVDVEAQARLKTLVYMPGSASRHGTGALASGSDKACVISRAARCG
jgi:hypothetical protein